MKTRTRKLTTEENDFYNNNVVLLHKGEIEHVRHLIRSVYPTGIVSIVSDTWDFWSIMTEGVRALKVDVLARNGKTVIRPDSGDPVKIICGDPDAELNTPEFKGAIQCLWDVFGGTTTSTGHRQLDSHVGLIYGDSITLERQQAILEGLSRKGFCSDVVLGIGSYTYQHVTRDTFGFAMKGTYGEVNGQPREIFKSPKTDKGSEKKSARGLVQVYRSMNSLTQQPKIEMRDGCDWKQESLGLLQDVFVDGRLFNQQSFADVRRTLHGDQF